ncbi:ATP-binding protein, partial [Chromatiaceae bacterium AAb-1]|nr:ATP-binding protein [Chromatiaceae bacterium AAb-1]
MSIRDLINNIKADFESKKFDKFIHEINFPKFKNFMPGAKICFRFPISVIVGPNGGGKSSILHAMWGMPQGYSTSRFWFSTPVDPIESTRGEQNRYWYTHYIKSVDRVVQCRKIAGNKRNGYWEPSRPNQSEGMDKMPPTN